MTRSLQGSPWRFVSNVGAALLAGCTVVSGEFGVSYQNRIDPGSSFLEPAQPVPRATMNWRPDKPNFVGVAISGGGSRAANFGMAVLTELQAQGMLAHVDAISAVSGEPRFSQEPARNSPASRRARNDPLILMLSGPKCR